MTHDATDSIYIMRNTNSEEAIKFEKMPLEFRIKSKEKEAQELGNPQLAVSGRHGRFGPDFMYYPIELK